MNLKQGFQLGEWSVQPLRGELIGPKGSRRLQPKAMDVLLCLVEKAPDVVERDSLLNAVWGANAVSDEPLTRCVGDLRKHLGDCRGRPRYVETIPKRGYRLLITGEPQAGAAAEAASSTTKEAPRSRDPSVPSRSVAVMPFLDLSDADNQGFFAEGMADEILTALARAPDLKVAARTSSFKLREEDHETVRRILGVRFVLEGSVKRHEDRIRVNVRLIDTNDGFQRFAKTIDRVGRDALKVQGELAQYIFDRLPAALVGRTAPDWSWSIPSSIEVHDLYLRGLHALNRRELQAADEYLRQACQSDPDFAPSLATRAAVLVLLPLYYLTRDSRATYAQARELAQRALERDPTSALAYTAMGMAHMGAYRWTDAEQELIQAIDVNPRDATAQHWYGMLELFKGNTTGAVNQLEIAHELDPLSPAILRELGLACYFAGLTEQGEKHLLQARALDPSNLTLTISAVFGMLLLEQGRYDEALVEMQRDLFLQHLAPESVVAIVDAVRTYQSIGKPGRLPEDLEARVFSPGTAGRLFALAGHAERALACLRRGLQSADLWVMLFTADPALRRIRETPEGKALLATIRKVGV
ncbi:MAG: winged helix-turn-helix domain-containing protein [Gammaproteobacteria bacterium]